jgi:hypothetical protein
MTRKDFAGDGVLDEEPVSGGALEEVVESGERELAFGRREPPAKAK